MKQYKWITITILMLYLKSILFTLFIASNNGYYLSTIEFKISLIIIHCIILGVIVFPSLLFKNKGFIRYLILINLIYTIFLIINLWTYRGTGHLSEIKFIFNSEGFNTLGQGIINPSYKDILFFIDIFITIFIYRINKNNFKYIDKKILSLTLVGLSIVITLISHYLIDIKDITNGKLKFIQDRWEANWNISTRVAYRSPIIHCIYDGYKNIKKIDESKEYEKYFNEIDEWLSWNNENLEDNKYKGIFKDKNVIFLQIESLENFVINQKIYNQEITPNLNKLTKEGLYFNNIYEQNNAGNSIDMDMMAASGVLPLGDYITYLEYPEIKYPSLPRLLNKEGYNTILTHAERVGDWNWGEAGKVAAGYKTIWDINDYVIDEYAGFGLSDRSLYTQLIEKLSQEEGPFLAVVPTLTSHGPFDLAEEFRELDLPKELDENRLGGYFQSVNYADKQIGLLFELLEQKGMLDNTVVVIYGDHGGIHKYYMEDVEASNIEGDWWQNRDSKIPLIIYGTNIENKVIETYGGHIDIVPTVAYLLGLETNNYQMGRNLLNTNRDATVIKGGVVVGNPSKEDEKMFGKAYEIADKIIKGNYYYKTNKVE